ncbi:Ankyrin repeat-containing protein [Pleurostoma richardsiae]|uniref:Ankyrin repeat-containing protein n=1 Tax=Pleurostoma richardsiae TaxID=41990 RepID=A0AA38R5N2_9PEZI|nr:Ankyrin repeat-containing protein [Pleurostoma richardsiae]
MSFAVANASRLKPEIRLAQAVSEFEASLSGEQKATFRAQRSKASLSPPQIGDVRAVVAEIDRTSGGKVGARCFGPRLISLLQAVQQFAGLGDILVGGSQNLIACGVWSVVRLTLLLLSGGASSLEKLSLLFMRVGRSAPRYELLAILYPRSKALRSDLSEYFIVVVKLCQHVMRLANKSVLATLIGSVDESSLKSLEADLELWSSSIREQVGILTSQRVEEEAKENSRFRSVVARMAVPLSQSKVFEMQLRWLKACSSYRHEKTWKFLRKRGNATAFKNDKEYRTWRTESRSSTFIVSGKLGSGKSILLANIVDDLSIGNKKANIMYFFCRHDDPESLTTRSVTGSFARQVLQFLFDNNDEIVKSLRSLRPPLDEDGILASLEYVIPREHCAYFILDGLDECDENARITILDTMRRFQDIFNLHLWELGTRDPGLLREIENALLEGAQGMFLWVVLQIDCICMEKTDGGIRESIGNLPSDLYSLFCRVLDKSKRLAPLFQPKILKCLLAAYRPLTAEELREALAVKAGITIRHRDWEVNDILSKFSSQQQESVL